jgi:hypothetical protein
MRLGARRVALPCTRRRSCAGGTGRCDPVMLGCLHCLGFAVDGAEPGAVSAALRDQAAAPFAGGRGGRGHLIERAGGLVSLVAGRAKLAGNRRYRSALGTRGYGHATHHTHQTYAYQQAKRQNRKKDRQCSPRRRRSACTIESMVDDRPQADRILVAQLTGETRHRARWRELTEAEETAAVVALRELAGGRTDLLAQVAGIFEGTSEGELDEPLARCAAQLCRMAGADPAAIPAWIEEGKRRRASASKPPFSGGLHLSPRLVWAGNRGYGHSWVPQLM